MEPDDIFIVEYVSRVRRGVVVRSCITGKGMVCTHDIFGNGEEVVGACLYKRGSDYVLVERKVAISEYPEYFV